MSNRLGRLGLVGVALVLVFGAGFLAQGSGAAPLQAVQNWQDGLKEQLTVGAALALLIERSVEVWLNATGQNGPDRHEAAPAATTNPAPAAPAAVIPDPAAPVVANPAPAAPVPVNPDPVVSAAVPAAVASLALGVLTALIGVRFLGSVYATPTGVFLGTLWQGVDIVITGGLLAGGSTLMHELVEGVVVGGLKRVSSGLTPNKD